MLTELIEALQILAKYDNPLYPTCCEHDELYVLVDANKVSKKDKQKLDKLGFFENDNGQFSSFRYGST